MKRSIFPLKHLKREIYCFVDSLSLCRTLLEAGAKIIQLRAKKLGDIEFRQLAASMQEIVKLKSPEAILVINDRFDIAMEIGADGVHVGQDDFDYKIAIERARSDMIVGVTVKSVDQALAAQNAGATYIGAGAIFVSQTKTDTQVIGLDKLRAIVDATEIPVVAIGGITLDNIDMVIDAGAHFFAVISDINNADDIRGRFKAFEGKLCHQLF